MILSCLRWMLVRPGKIESTEDVLLKRERLNKHRLLIIMGVLSNATRVLQEIIDDPLKPSLYRQKEGSATQDFLLF
jgi:hypothetical protein